MARYQVDVETGAFEAGIPAAIEEYRGLAEIFIVEVADKVVLIAKSLAPVSPRAPAGELVASIRHERAVSVEHGLEILVIADAREAIYMEFGTYKDRPQPFMRPALAQAAGGLRSLGYAARLSYSTRASLFVRRSRARIKVQGAQRRGLRLSVQERKAVAATISQRLRYRGPKVTYRRPSRRRGG